MITIFSNVEQRQTKQTKMLLDDDGRVHWVQYSDDISINRMWHLVFLDCIGKIIIDKPIRRRMWKMVTCAFYSCAWCRSGAYRLDNDLFLLLGNIICVYGFCIDSRVNWVNA